MLRQTSLFTCLLSLPSGNLIHSQTVVTRTGSATPLLCLSATWKGNLHMGKEPVLVLGDDLCGLKYMPLTLVPRFVAGTRQSTPMFGGSQAAAGECGVT